MANTFIGAIITLLGGLLGYAFADSTGAIGGSILGAVLAFGVAVARRQVRDGS